MNRRSRSSLLGALLSLVGATAMAQPVVPVTVTGDPANRIDIVIVSEGYTAAQMPQFASDVNTYIASMFAQDPYREYQAYFNIRRLEVASVASGASHSGSPGNTAFGAYYNCQGIERLICVNVNWVLTATSVLPANQADIILVLVNDTEYGGGGGQVAVASLNSYAVEVILHELGHSFALLGDEYGGPPPPACNDSVEPSYLNVTKQTDRASIKWNQWIDPSTPLPTTYSMDGIPGIYAGADYCDTTLFRPTYNSKMRNLNQPFWQINTEQLVRRFYTYTSPIDSVAPPTASAVTLAAGQSQTFSVVTPPPATHALDIEWWLDGALKSSGPQFSLGASALAAGNHTLQVKVADTTAMVRSDPNQLLTEDATWTVTSTASPALAVTSTHAGSFAQGQSGAAYTITVSNGASAAATNGTVTVTETVPSGLALAGMNGAGWSCSGNTCTRADVLNGGSSYPPIAVTVNVAGNAPSQVTNQVSVSGGGSAEAQASDVTSINRAGGLGSALRFVPVIPCRVADTRNPEGDFGGPGMPGDSTRSFAIPRSGCGIPDTAQAYSLNVTVVPKGRLSFLTLFPAGQQRPVVSTLNSFGGIVVANAAIVPAGAGGAVSVYVTDATDVILDIDGYFDSSSGAVSYSFYPAAPCRIADTRNPAGVFGGPTIPGAQSRDFPIPSSSCSIPDTAKAYSLNVTAVPHGYLGYLTTWPAGQAKPTVSTLNSWTGKVVANAAIVPAGAGPISVFVSNMSDVILDVNGFFGTPGGSGELLFYPVTPCRVADTRRAQDEFGGPEMTAGTTRSFTVPASGCHIPSNAAAYSLNVTVVPDGALSYLTAWPTGSPRPQVSTLNSFDGAVVANAAVVPAGTGGAISVFVTNQTHVILDIDGYFAP